MLIGLDSTTAFTVIEGLKNIATNKKSTLLVTIHQPSAKIYALFDKCLFLSNGKVTFTGPAYQLRGRVEQISKAANYTNAVQDNAPEEFLDLCDRLREEDKLDLIIIDTANVGKMDTTFGGDEVATASYANNFFMETYYLFRRNLTNILRVKELFFARIGACLGFGFLIGSLFYNRPSTLEGTTEMVAYFVFAIAFFLYTALEALPIFFTEREIFMREYSRGAYRASSYVVATTLVYLPFLLILSAVFLITSWWLVGLTPRVAEVWFFQLFMLLLTLKAGHSFATMISVLVPDPMTGQTAGSGLLSVMFLFSGFFIKAGRIPPWWIWIHYLSLFKYAYDSMIINAIKGHVSVPGMTESELLDYFSVDGFTKWRGVGVLICFICVYRFITYLVLITKHNGSRKA